MISRAMGICITATILAIGFAGCASENDASPSNDLASASTSQALSTPGVMTVFDSKGKTQYYAPPQLPSGSGAGRVTVRRRTDASGTLLAGAPTPGTGWNLHDIQDVYGIPSSGGPSPIVAIFAFFDNPNAEADMNVYRAQYGIPPCTTAGGCFTKVNEQGATSPLPSQVPLSDPNNYAVETALDVDMVSAACPTCKVLLVELSATGTSNLLTAWASAITANATFLTNSLIWAETSGLAGYESSPVFSHSGVTLFAGAGDNGFGTGWPSTSAHVVSVGGTTFGQNDAGWWIQSTWSRTGAGCSSVISRPSWQPTTWCGTLRTVNDVSALAQNVEIYDSWLNTPGWLEVAGTSAATPLVAGIYATNGWNGAGPSYAYSHPSSFTDVTTGNDGACPGASTPSLCTAGPGFDGPTGNGTPHGTIFFVTPNPISVSAGVGAQAQVVAGDWANDPSAPAYYSLTGPTVAGTEPSLATSDGSTTFDFISNGSTPPQTLVYGVKGTAGSVTNTTSVTVNVTPCVAQTPTVACDGRSCGSTQDICGNTVECGTCAAGQTCTYNQCAACAPKLCPKPEFWDPSLCECRGCACGTVIVGGKAVCAVCRP